MSFTSQVSPGLERELFALTKCVFPSHALIRYVLINCNHQCPGLLKENHVNWIQWRNRYKSESNSRVNDFTSLPPKPFLTFFLFCLSLGTIGAPSSTGRRNQLDHPESHPTLVPSLYPITRLVQASHVSSHPSDNLHPSIPSFFHH